MKETFMATKTDTKSEAQPDKKTDKKERILEAMLDLIVERGFHDSPMSLLAKRSGTSAGVMYHYFPSKEDLIHALYLRVRSTKRDVLLAGYVSSMSEHDAFVHIWTNAYRFYRSHLRETRFLDQYENSPFACVPAEEPAEQDPETNEFQRRFRSRRRGGILNNLPPEVVQELTFGLAARLAKKPDPLSLTALKKVAETVWTAITS